MRILSFDVEDWFHLLQGDQERTASARGRAPRLRRNVDRILRLLEARNLRATFFCLGWAAKEFPDVVRRIADEGHEIGSHSNLHRPPTQLGRARFVDDLRRSTGSLEDLTSVQVRAFRAPGFVFGAATPWLTEALLEARIEVDSSVFPGVHAHGGMPGYPSQRPHLIRTPSGLLREFPIPQVGLGPLRTGFSGGGYFRLLPWPVIRTLVRRRGYVMTWFHPRDFDPGQPYLPLSPLPFFRAYVGIRSAWAKLERLLDVFDFVSLGQAERAIDWNSVPVLEWAPQD